MSFIHWDIGRAGRAWTGAEVEERLHHCPEKLEVVQGKLLGSDEARIKLLGLLLENVGTDQAVKLGNPRGWLDAADTLKPFWARRSFLGDPFNRWMLALWCVNLIVMAGVVFLTLSGPERPRLSPDGESLLLSALVALVTSFAVNAFLKP
jgi:hypothetical protein